MEYLCCCSFLHIKVTQHAINCGVRTIEHGNLIDRETANLMASKNVYLVPTLITYDALDRKGAQLGLPQTSIEKFGESKIPVKAKEKVKTMELVHLPL